MPTFKYTLSLYSGVEKVVEVVSANRDAADAKVRRDYGVTSAGVISCEESGPGESALSSAEEDALAMALVLDESAEPRNALIMLDPPTWAIVSRVLTAAGRLVRSVATPEDFEPTGGVEAAATAAHEGWVRALILYCKHSSSDNLAALWLAARADRAALVALLKR